MLVTVSDYVRMNFRILGQWTSLVKGIQIYQICVQVHNNNDEIITTVIELL